MVLHGHGPEEDRALGDLLLEEHGRELGEVLVGVEISGELALHVGPVVRGRGGLGVYGAKSPEKNMSWKPRAV